MVKDLDIPNQQGMESNGHVENAGTKTKFYWCFNFFQLNSDNDITTL